MSVILSLALLSACSTNPATGDQQFTALMSPQKERQIGAQEHESVKKTYGLLPLESPLSRYVNTIGQRVAKDTERTDVQYNFYVVDDPMVNAFALPGGYVYVSRGLLAQANNEAQLAAVIAHEIGHVTARHSAERYSQGVLASLGTLALGLAVDSPSARQLASLGSELYIKSYSRGQEYESDDLGIRYLVQSGYSPYEMAGFLEALEASDALERKLSGVSGDGGFSFFDTHPQTAERVGRARAAASQYQGQMAGGGRIARNEYLSALDGMIYGHSSRHGFTRGQDYYHPDLGFTFSVPDGFTVINQPTKVVAVSPAQDTTIIFDAASNVGNIAPETYIAQVWLKGEPAQGLERISVNGKNAATATFTGQISGQPVNVRLVAIAWDAKTFYRFQIAYPQNASSALVEDLQRTTYSLRAMTASEKQTITPYKIRVVTAGANDTLQTLAARFPYDDYKAERFRVLNGLKAGESVRAGERYKTISP